jgi:hypothetical protein
MAEVDVSALLNLVSATAVVVGVLVALAQIRQGERKRHDQAAIAAVQGVQSAEAFEAARRILLLREGMTTKEIETEGPDVARAANILHMAFEPLGYMVYLRVVPLADVDRLAGGAVRGTWKRLRPLVEEERARTGTPSRYEWFQWLAEQLEAHPTPGKAQGAYAAYRDWKP